MINDIFRNLTSLERSFAGGTTSHCALALPTDITETDREHILRMDVPGIPRERINIQFNDGVLSVETGLEVTTDEDTGENAKDAGKDEVRYHLNERLTGKGIRRFRLPRHVVDKSCIDAKLADGILTIKLTKPDPDQSREANQIIIN